MCYSGELLYFQVLKNSYIQAGEMAQLLQAHNQLHTKERSPSQVLAASREHIHCCFLVRAILVERASFTSPGAVRRLNWHTGGEALGKDRVLWTPKMFHAILREDTGQPDDFAEGRLGQVALRWRATLSDTKVGLQSACMSH